MTTEELIAILEQHPGKQIGWSCNDEYGPAPVEASNFRPARMAIKSCGEFDYAFPDNQHLVQDVLMIQIME